MKNDFAIAVGNSTANFISKNILVCGQIDKTIFSAVSESGTIINLCFESAWFSLASTIKSKLIGRDVVSFCLSDGLPYENQVERLLSSVSDFKTVIVSGSEELATFVLKKYNESDVKIIYIPLDFDYEFFIKHLLKNNLKGRLLLDEKVLAKCNRSSFADCVRRIFASKIIAVEMAVNSAIAGDNGENQAQKQIDECKIYLQKYLDTHLITYLVISHLKSIIAQSISGVESIPSIAGEILNKLNTNLSLRGEREYLIYKMILRLYKFYFSNDTSFILNKCGIASQEAQLNKIMGECCLIDYSLPETVYKSDAELSDVKQKISSSEKVIKLLDEYLLQLESEAQILRKEFGGRKYTVEHYNTKQRATALTLAPYLIKEKTAYLLLFASGILESFL